MGTETSLDVLAEISDKLTQVTDMGIYFAMMLGFLVGVLLATIVIKGFDR